MPTREQCDEAARHRAGTRRRRPLLRALALVLPMGLAALLVAAPAQAIFNRTATAPASIGTATVGQPASVTLTLINCMPNTLTLRVNWPAVPAAGSYRVTPRINGVAQTPITVPSGLLYNYSVATPGPMTRAFTFDVQALRSTWSGLARTSTSTTC